VSVLVNKMFQVEFHKDRY